MSAPFLQASWYRRTAFSKIRTKIKKAGPRRKPEGAVQTMQKRHQYSREKRKRILPRKRAAAQCKKCTARSFFWTSLSPTMRQRRRCVKTSGEILEQFPLQERERRELTARHASDVANNSFYSWQAKFNAISIYVSRIIILIMYFTCPRPACFDRATPHGVCLAGKYDNSDAIAPGHPCSPSRPIFP